ncbi:MAG: hypothetical protein GWO17_03490 [Gemmatimonadetes bacterium]|nr:hypothetical protein [Gemmatimonadota bacterium]
MIVYLIFATLLSLVGEVDGIARSTPVVREWLAFAALMIWLVAHSLVPVEGRAGTGA